MHTNALVFCVTTAILEITLVIWSFYESMYLSNASVTDMIWHKVNFFAEKSWFEFRTFFFFFAWLIALPMLKNPICDTIHP